jgi:hypothetical protein
VCHYIHLNPVRAGIVPVEEAGTYRWGSLHLWGLRKKRPTWLCVEDALVSAGMLPDTPAGHRAYVDYLAWLAGDREAQKAFAFDKMSKGWVLGSDAFKRALIDEHKQELAKLDLGEADLGEIKRARWENALSACLKRLAKTPADATRDRKASDWKVAIAAHLRATTTVKNPWLAERLVMGDPDGVSRYVSEARQGRRPGAARIMARITDIRV